MKLSKAQQSVVEKMRDGLYITFVKGTYPYAYIVQGKRLNIKTFLSLRDKGIIESTNNKSTYEDYRLTEQYKNEQR